MSIVGMVVVRVVVEIDAVKDVVGRDGIRTIASVHEFLLVCRHQLK